MSNNRYSLRLHGHGDIKGKGWNPAWDETPVAPWDRDDEVVLSDEAAHSVEQDLFGVEDAMIEAIESGEFREASEAGTSEDRHYDRIMNDATDRWFYSDLADGLAVMDGSFGTDNKGKAAMAEYYEQMAEYYEQMAERVGANNLPEICRPVRETMGFGKTAKKSGKDGHEHHKGPGRGWKVGFPTNHYERFYQRDIVTDSERRAFIAGKGSRGNCYAAYHAADNRRRAIRQWAKNAPTHARHDEPMNVLSVGY